MSQYLPTTSPSAVSLPTPSETVARFLASFNNRQSRLQAIRGSAIAIIVLLCGVGLIVAIDWLIQLPEMGRWLLTCSSYAIAFVSAWRIGLSQVFFWPSLENVAWSVEQSSPHFRESLLATVELRRPDGTTRSGSPLFVAALEHNVAHELRSLEIDTLLPWRALSKILVALIAVLGGVVAACCIPDAKLSERLARAMIPFVAFERPSNIQITILDPSPNSLSVPSDQIIPFVVQITGGSPTDATLELIESDGTQVRIGDSKRGQNSRRSLKMNFVGDSSRLFSISAPISDLPTRFRVIAGDAETLFRTIHPIARPKVLAFHSEIKPPAYTLDAKELASTPRGDLRVLKGSRVKLDIDVNQALSNSLIVMEFPASGRKETIALQQAQSIGAIPLASNAIQRFTAEWVVEEDATYQVRLTSNFKYKGNGIENTYSPRYRLDTFEDSPPMISWKATGKTIWAELPKPNQAFIVAPDEIVNLSATVSDNLPIEHLLHEASINRGPWIAVEPNLNRTTIANSPPIVSEGQSSKKVFIAQPDWTWDLLGLVASSGDSVATRVTAIDRKGNTSHSPTILFSLASPGFDRDRHSSLIRRMELVPLLDALSVALNRSRDQLRPQLDKLKDIKLPLDERAKSISELRTTVLASVKAAQAVQQSAEAIMKELGRCVDQAEVELVVRLIARIEKEWLASMSFGVDASVPSLDTVRDPQSVAWTQKEYEQRINRLLQAYDSACDNSKRCTDIYRQFLGLELQASLTHDLTNLRDHQQSVLDRTPPADFTTLARSQQMAEQYTDAIVKLATDVEPNLNQDFRNRISELYRWIDQTRTEIGELVKQEPSDQASIELRSRIDRSTIELKNVRWAYNLQGNLTWDAINSRKELVNRSGSLWSNFERFSERHNRRTEVNKEKSLATDESLTRNESLIREVTGPILSALGQMLDRRDIHQRRSFTDPLFASDMGMAYRAWTSLLERWVSEPMNANSLFTDTQSIAKAYRILESAHETVEARMVVQSLLPIEQYEWKSLEGQLINPKQWDSVNVRLEIAHQWMREAGIPHVVAEKYNALRWSEPAQKINSKLSSRRDANNTNLVSSADELRLLLLLWSAADRDAKPILDAARATLAKFSPSVSSLAKQAANATQKLQRLTENMNAIKPEMKQDKDASRNHSIPSQDQIQREREASESRISQLQDALIELANKQDLLDQAELDAARDSDRSLKLLDAVVPMMNEAIDVVLEAEGEQASDKLEMVNEAIRRESKAVTALEKISAHFAMLAEHSEDSETSRELAQSSLELSKMAEEALTELSRLPESIPQRDDAQDYLRAEQLTALANSDPESLLKQLESELKRNPPMQQELSEISKANAQSLAKELQNASRTEESLAKQLERADARLTGEKRLRLDQLKAASEQTDRFAARLLDNAARAAQRAGDKDQSSAIARAVAELRQASQSVKGLSEDTSRREIESASEELAASLDQTLKQVQSASQAVQPTIERANEKDERRRQNAKSETQNIQNQNRNEILHQAKEYAAHTQRQSDQAKRRLQQIQAELDNANKQRQSAVTNFQKDPDNESLLESLRQATGKVEQAFVKKQTEEKLAAQAESFVNHAKVQMESFERAERADLDRPNPQAALAVEQLERAKEQLGQLQEQVKSIAELAKQLPQPQTLASTLLNEVREQLQVQEKVLDVANQLARSGRHEERLGNERAAKDLAGQAESVDEVARGSLIQAKEELNRASESAKRSEHQQYDSVKNEEVRGPFNRPDASSSQEKLNLAAQDLAAQAEQIEQQIGEMKGSQKASPITNASTDKDPPAKRDAKQAESRDMARMLDVLDRQLNSPPISNNNPAKGDSNSNDGLPSKGSEPSESQSSSSKNNTGEEDRNGTRSDFKDSVKSSAEKLAGAMGQERISRRSASQTAKDSGKDSKGKTTRGNQLGQGPNFDNGGEFVLPGVARGQYKDWGKLREQRAEDAVEGRRDDFDPEFSEAIQAYYKALGNR